jgi:hypothetical protein
MSRLAKEKMQTAIEDAECTKWLDAIYEKFMTAIKKA